MSGKVNEARTFARNAKGVREVLNMKFDTLPFEGDWFEAFNTPDVVVSGLSGGTRVTENFFRDAALQIFMPVRACGL